MGSCQQLAEQLLVGTPKSHLGSCKTQPYYSFVAPAIDRWDRGAIAMKDGLIYLLTGHVFDNPTFVAYTMEGEFVKTISTFPNQLDIGVGGWHKRL